MQVNYVADGEGPVDDLAYASMYADIENQARAQILTHECVHPGHISDDSDSDGDYADIHEIINKVKDLGNGGLTDGEGNLFECSKDEIFTMTLDVEEKIAATPKELAPEDLVKLGRIYNQMEKSTLIEACEGKLFEVGTGVYHSGINVGYIIDYIGNIENLFVLVNISRADIPLDVGAELFVSKVASCEGAITPGSEVEDSQDEDSDVELPSRSHDTSSGCVPPPPPMPAHRQKK